MGTVPTPHTWTAGDDATSTALQTLTDAILYLLGSATSGGSRRPFCLIRQTLTQSLTSAVWTAATFDAEDVDYDNGHSIATNTDRYTANTTGWHVVSGGGGVTANATGRRGARFSVALAATPTTAVAKDGCTAFVPDTNVGVVPRTAAFPVFLNAGDVLRLELFQNSGIALSTVVSGTDLEPSMFVELRSN